MDKRPRVDDSEVRKVRIFAVKHLIRCFYLERECGMRLHRYDAVILSSSHKKEGSPLSTSMQRTIPHNDVFGYTELLWRVGGSEFLS